MRLYVPACGDRLRLVADWNFLLYLEHRNMSFAKERNFLSKEEATPYSYVHNGVTHTSKHLRPVYEEIIGQDRWRRKLKPRDAMLPAGTILECDRVYIRANSKSHSEADDSYDSLTWKVVIKDKGSTKQRFWVKLSDCNLMEYELVSTYRDRIK